ncbi:MAG TPA: metal-dependent hydrolase [Gemmatimonadota bacterium]|nr:metal-dependent hydrolase [Gemmatimonadota bacterium]
MDNISHSLAGWALSRAAGPERPRGTTLGLVLASNLPDIDIVLQARSGATYLLFHRGVTHSLVGLALLPLALAAALWWGYGRRTEFRWLALVCACGVALHILYDVVTPWGTLLLYPFSADRYSLDWLFIVDLVTWALPVAGLVASWAWPTRARAVTVAWLVALLVYAAGAGLVHRGAVVTVIDAERSAGRAVAEAFVFPRPGAPWRWSGVAAAPRSTPEPRVSVYRISGIPPAVAPVGRIERGFDDPWVAAAFATRSGQAYLWWSRAPVAVTERESGEAIVTLRDLRYSRTLVPTAETWTPFTIRFRFAERTGDLLAVEW